MPVPARWKDLFNLGISSGAKASAAPTRETSLEEQISITTAALHLRDEAERDDGRLPREEKAKILMALKKPGITARQIDKAIQKFDAGKIRPVARLLDPVKCDIARLANRQDLKRMWQIKAMTDAQARAAEFIDPPMRKTLLYIAESMGKRREKGLSIPLKPDRMLALLLKKENVTESEMGAAYDAAVASGDIDKVKDKIEPKKKTFLAASAGLVYARKGLLDAPGAGANAPPVDSRKAGAANDITLSPSPPRTSPPPLPPAAKGLG
jgi:hypothetical protein